MATSIPTGRRTRITLAGIVLLAMSGGVLATMPGETNANPTLSLGELQVSGVNETINGNVTDVKLNARIDYSHDVADGTRRIVKLQVGATRDNMETVTFAQSEIEQGRASGEVTLEASALEAQAFSAGEFQPELADSKTRTIYVGVLVEVRRENGESVTESVVREATVTLHDGGTITVDVGGNVGVVVVTD